MKPPTPSLEGAYGFLWRWITVWITLWISYLRGLFLAEKLKIGYN
jgi:hypothetical protein